MHAWTRTLAGSLRARAPALAGPLQGPGSFPNRICAERRPRMQTEPLESANPTGMLNPLKAQVQHAGRHSRECGTDMQAELL